MTHNELLNKVNTLGHTSCWAALLAILELHKPKTNNAKQCICGNNYPCREVKAIQKEII